MSEQERIFGISRDNKGLACPFTPILCQEGYCKACQIYLDWQKLGEIVVICGWCGKEMDRKPRRGKPGVAHGICPECAQKYFPAETEAGQKARRERHGRA